jgi:hypothetical protein
MNLAKQCRMHAVFTHLYFALTPVNDFPVHPFARCTFSFFAAPRKEHHET